MAVRSREEILSNLTPLLGDNSDTAISLVEDITDTFTDLENKVKGDGKDWKAEAERIDKEWREKYVKRFTSGPTEDEPKPIVGGGEKKYTYENLFKEKE